MNRKEFFAQLPGDLSENELEYVKNAYWISKLIHQQQTRDSGERYFEHPRRVACDVIKYCDQRAYLISEVVLALLHDGEEDGFPPEGLLERLFGPNMYRGLALLSKMVHTFNKSTGEIIKTKKDTDTYYRSIASDPWLSIRKIKMLDRLDNLRSLDVWPLEKQEKYLKETEKYILPMAHKTNEKIAALLEKECQHIRSNLKKKSTQ